MGRDEQDGFPSVNIPCMLSGNSLIECEPGGAYNPREVAQGTIA